MKRDLTKTAAYDYNLPKELIAQDPAEPRDSSRLMVVHKKDGATEDRIFRDITEYLNPGDLLVLNDTRVLPARVEASKKAESTARTSRYSSSTRRRAERMDGARPPGTQTARRHEGRARRRYRCDGRRAPRRRPAHADIRKGRRPARDNTQIRQDAAPHYITDTHAEPERYQTVYAKAEKENSVAAPTAGLHFTPELLQKLEGQWRAARLRHAARRPRHIPPGQGGEHRRPHNARRILRNTARDRHGDKRGEGARRGASSRSARPSCARSNRSRSATEKSSQARSIRGLFISPGFEFRVIDALITNFHLPMSTLLMLVSAFGGYDTMMSAYNEARAQTLPLLLVRRLDVHRIGATRNDGKDVRHEKLPRRARRA